MKKKITINPMQTDLERYKASIDIIFTRDNLPAILAVLNSLIPRDKERVYDTEYLTIIKAAKYDASLELINGVVTFVANK